MPRNPTSHVRGVSVAVLVLVTVAILLVISSCSSSSASASPAAEPSSVRLSKLEASVRLLRREVGRQSIELGRLDGLTHTAACVLRIYEDGSAVLLDAEQVDGDCRDWIGDYVGSGDYADDRR